MNPLPIKEIEDIRTFAKNLEHKRVLLTGSEGFLGTWIKAALIPICFLHSVDIKNGDDVTDAELFSEIAEPFEFIIHAAGYASPKVYKDAPLKTIAVAVNGTANLLNLATKFKSRMLFFSSSEIYGNPIEIPTKENDVGRVACRGPRACYDESKRLAETLCQVYFELYGTKVVTVRPFNVYGPGMALDDGRAVAAFSKAALNNSEIEVFGSGNQTRTYCYIGDAIKGFLAALQYGQAGRVYNIGTAFPEISALDLARKIVQISGSKSTVVARGNIPADYPADEPQRRCPDIRRANEELNFFPEVGLVEGIRKYLSWVLKYD